MTVRGAAARVFGVVAALAAVVAAAGWATLSLDAFGGVRNRLAEELLVQQFGRRTDVAGPTVVVLGASTTISVDGIRPKGADPGTPAQGLRATFSLRDAMSGRFVPTAMTASGLQVSLDAAAGRNEAPLGERLAHAATGVLTHPLSRDLTFEDVTISRAEDPDGWNFELYVERASGRQRADGAGVALALSGTLNGRALVASLDAPQADAADRSFVVTLDVAGLSARIEGTLGDDPSDPEVEGRVAFSSASFGDLLEVLRIAREIDGTGRLEASLAGSLSRPQLSDLSFSARTAGGRTLSVSGAVGDAWSAEGLDLRVDLADIASPGASPLAPRRVEGAMRGDFGGFEVRDLEIETGLASIDLNRIGPVSVARVWRDPQGRVRLDDLRVLQGDPEAPAIDMTGDVGDVFGLRGIEASGSFNLDLASLAGLQGALGSIRGTVALSDASGVLAPVQLDARDDGRGPLRFAMSRRDDGAFDVEAEVPDLAALGRATGVEAAGGPLGFDGALRIGGERFDADGAFVVGDAAMDARLSFDVVRSSLTGSLRSDRLRLDGLGEARAAARVFEAVRPTTVELNEDVASAAAASLSVVAGRVDAPDGRAAMRDVSANIGYASGRLGIEDISAAAFGGSVTASVAARLDRAPRPLQVDAAARSVELADLLSAFDLPPAASGPLDLDVSVETVVGDGAKLIAALDGRVDAAIGAGRLGNDLLNLAGDSVLGWALTRSPDGSAPLVCAVATLSLDQGVGELSRMILETETVRFSGTGRIDLRNRTLALEAVPRAKRDLPIGAVGPISVTGRLDAPKIELRDGAVVGKVVGDAVGTPLRLLGRLLPRDQDAPAPQEPSCRGDAGAP